MNIVLCLSSYDGGLFLVVIWNCFCRKNQFSLITVDLVDLTGFGTISIFIDCVAVLHTTVILTCTRDGH